MGKLFIPRLEEVHNEDGGEEAINVWENFGVYDNMMDALTCRQSVIDAALGGDYEIANGNYHAFTVAVEDAETYGTEDVVDVITNIEESVKEKRPFYWSVWPAHGMVWAESAEGAQLEVFENFRFYDGKTYSIDDVAIYPIYSDVHEPFQVFDY